MREPTTQLAVLGSPVAHSLSPLLHSSAYRLLGLDWRYTAIEVTEAMLPEFVASRDASWRGLSLTMPLKRAIGPLLDTHDSPSALLGVTNTVLFDGSRQHGFNTDVAGIVGALTSHGVTACHTVDLIGAGATASSALLACADLGARHITAWVRTPGSEAELRQLADHIGMTFSAQPLAECGAGRTPGSLVVSTVPGGTELPSFPQAEPGEVFFDVAYDPWPTPAAARWTQDGGVVISGIHMLIHQAVRQIRIFVSGCADQALPDEDAVLATLRAAVPQFTSR